MNMEERLQAVVSRAETDGTLWHTIIHGTNSTTITTENGKVPSVSKQLKDVRDELINGAADYLGSCLQAKSETTVIRDNALVIKSEIEQLKADTQEFRNTAESYKNMAQTTFNSVSSAVSQGISNIQAEGSTQVLNVKTAVAEQVAEATAQADRAASLLNSKTNIDGSNINATFKQLILSLLSPNYNGAKSISTPYTAPSAGYIFVKTAGNGNYCNLTIDGFSQISTGGNFSNYHEADTTSYHIGKGSVASWSGSCSVWFIPCQGA